MKNQKSPWHYQKRVNTTRVINSTAQQQVKRALTIHVPKTWVTSKLTATLQSKTQAWDLAQGEHCHREVTMPAPRLLSGLTYRVQNRLLTPQLSIHITQACTQYCTCLKYSPLKAEFAPHHLTQTVEKPGHNIFNFISSYWAMIQINQKH